MAEKFIGQTRMEIAVRGGQCQALNNWVGCRPIRIMGTIDEFTENGQAL